MSRGIISALLPFFRPNGPFFDSGPQWNGRTCSASQSRPIGIRFDSESDPLRFPPPIKIKKRHITTVAAGSPDSWLDFIPRSSSSILPPSSPFCPIFYTLPPPLQPGPSPAHPSIISFSFIWRNKKDTIHPPTQRKSQKRLTLLLPICHLCFRLLRLHSPPPPPTSAKSIIPRRLFFFSLFFIFPFFDILLRSLP